MPLNCLFYIYNSKYLYVLSLLAQRKDERKGAPVNPPFGFVYSLEKSGSRTNFFRIEEIDAPEVRLKGEGHGCPESQFGRTAELDALHVRPQGEGQGRPESNSLRFSPLKQILLSTDFPFAHSPGSEGGISVLNISAMYTFL
jgi:hypothetical protein